ncbi:6-phosphogluconolactonase [Candidatus Peregrinibacteria bacterium]|nr:6-phosphogluconolactonase [Candidatus Peregrinibacteria bacterium]
MKNYQLIETASEQEFVQKSVTFLKQKIEDSIVQRDHCIIGFSGGSTPRPIYQALEKEKMNWSKISGFLIDERYVPPDDPKSNQYLIRKTLPNISLTVPDSSLPIKTCIQKYVKDLKELWAKHLPDIIVLGMGTDGHIASLFPPLPPNLRDDSLLIAHTHTDTFDIPDRITLTLNPILAATSHILLLRGRDKKKTWDKMLKSSGGESSWPMKAVLEQSDVTVIRNIH